VHFSDLWTTFLTVREDYEEHDNPGSLLLLALRLAQTQNSDGDGVDAAVLRCTQRMRGSNSGG
jgi:hypothetical protein